MAFSDGAKRALDNMRQMKDKRGPGYRKWKRAMEAWRAAGRPRKNKK